MLVAPIFLDAQAYSSSDKTRTYYKTLFDRLSAIPGGERCCSDHRAGQPARSGLPTSGLARRTSSIHRNTPAFVHSDAGYFPVMKLRVAEAARSTIAISRLRPLSS